MADKNAQTITQPSNRAKAKDERETKTVFKAVLDNPHRIHWPSVPLNLQNAILAKILQLLDGASEYQLPRFAARRKRKCREKTWETKRQKQDESQAQTSALDCVNEDAPVHSDSEHSQADMVLEPPALFRNLVYGINEVTKRLENQVQAVRRPVVAMLPEQPAKDSVPALQSIFVCRSDVNLSLTLDHIPHLVAAYNSSRPPSFLTLVPLPKGAELSLAQTLGIRRVAVFGIEILYSNDPSLKSLLDKVPILTASWLSQADTSHTLIPTHVKQLRTTAPKDMKAAKESRNKERALAKQRKRLNKGKEEFDSKERDVTGAKVKFTGPFIGTRFSGKTSIENYLVYSKGFTCVRLLNDQLREELTKDIGVEGQYRPIYFSTTKELLDYVTENWRKDFVTSDLLSRKLIEPFSRRPFFLILQCNAPILERFRRSQSTCNLSMVDFLEEDDRTVFGTCDRKLQPTETGLHLMADLVNISVINSFPTLQQLHSYLDRLDLLDSEHLRPSWDSYFMTLASLASRRSNCMKRRVGAILVRQNRVLASGYNGTPRGLQNCNEGGCSHCNLTDKSNLISNECLCLHAEENALLEAGRERLGNDCVLYCNTCPCLKCTIKIIQTGVKTVVYNLTYKVDDASARLFEEAAVELRRFDPNRWLNLLPEEGSLEIQQV